MCNQVQRDINECENFKASLCMIGIFLSLMSTCANLENTGVYAPLN